MIAFCRALAVSPPDVCEVCDGVEALLPAHVNISPVSSASEAAVVVLQKKAADVLLFTPGGRVKEENGV